MYQNSPTVTPCFSFLLADPVSTHFLSASGRGEPDDIWIVIKKVVQDVTGPDRVQGGNKRQPP